LAPGLFALGADFLFEILETSEDVLLGLFDPFFELLEAIAKVFVGLLESLVHLLESSFDLLEPFVHHPPLVSQSAGNRNAETNEQGNQLPDGVTDRRVDGFIELIDGTAHFGEFLDTSTLFRRSAISGLNVVLT
jgi:hypothetical protein